MRKYNNGIEGICFLESQKDKMQFYQMVLELLEKAFENLFFELDDAGVVSRFKDLKKFIFFTDRLTHMIKSNFENFGLVEGAALCVPLSFHCSFGPLWVGVFLDGVVEYSMAKFNVEIKNVTLEQSRIFFGEFMDVLPPELVLKLRISEWDKYVCLN